MTFSISTHRHDITTTHTHSNPTADPQQQKQEGIVQEQCNTSETVYHFSLFTIVRRVYRIVIGQVSPSTPAST